MADHERVFDDDSGMSDGVNATVRPKTVQAKAAVVATITAEAEVIAGLETTSLNFPVTRTLTLKLGVDGNLHSYDLIEDGEVIWRGLGTNPQDGLLKIAIRIHEGEDPDFPKE